VIVSTYAYQLNLLSLSSLFLLSLLSLLFPSFLSSSFLFPLFSAKKFFSREGAASSLEREGERERERGIVLMVRRYDSR